MIAGFCTENETDHQDTLSLMDHVIYDFGYMFTYSERPGTPAEKKYQDDVEESIKQRRLSEIIAKQRLHSGIKKSNQVHPKTKKDRSARRRRQGP
jgi:tRNA-2-methylthio-N6-dimethylallyladenosine synthase